MTLRLVLSALWLILPAAAFAQQVELELGAGYVFGGGVEDPGPSLATVDAAVAVWPSERWGVAVRLVEGPGEDLHEPIASGDRTFFGLADLHYWTVTARRRIPLSSARRIDVGFGGLFGGRFSSVEQLHDPPLRGGARTTFSGFALESFLTQSVADHFAVRGGATLDFSLETTNFQPVILAVLKF
jgi:hypothetical protein